jgi:hypothetical protein
MALGPYFRKRWWEPVVLMMAAFALFWPTLGIGLLSDDHVAVWRTGVLGQPWRTGFFRPLSDLSIAWGHALHGPGGLGYHAFNVALHGVNAWLVLLLARQWLSALHGPVVAWMAALLFLVYPFHLESVIWVVGRESALAAFFGLLAFVVLGSAWPERRRAWVSAGAFFLGALCYESALLLPVLLFPLVAARRPVAWPRFGKWVLAWGTALVLHVAVRPWKADMAAGSYGAGFFGHGPWNYVLNIPKVAGRLFLPPSADPGDQLWRFALLLAMALVVTITWGRRSRRSPGCLEPVEALLWSLAVTCLLAVLGGVSTRTMESDRFLYMPSVFLALLVAFAVLQFGNMVVRYVVFAAVLMVSVHFLWQGQRSWQEAYRLSAQVIADLPAPPPNARLLVHDLPDHVNGAFVFRNGFAEALLLAGRDTAGVVLVRGAQPVERGPGDVEWSPNIGL